jgi:hypothetical protein
MSNTARIGFGAILTDKGTGGSGTDKIGNVTDLNIGGISLATVDATHYESADAYQEFIAGLIDAGEVTATVQAQPAASGSADNWHFLYDALNARVLRTYELAFPNGAKFTFTAFVTNLGIPVPLADKITTTVTFKISGKPVLANS